MISILQEHLRSCVGQEYKPQDLLFGRDKISCLTSSQKLNVPLTKEVIG